MMIQRNWAVRMGSVACALTLALTALSPAMADNELLKLKNRTEVKLELDDSLNSKTAQPGDVVHMHVYEPVKVDGQTVIKTGTKVTGTVAKVNKRGRYGTNAKIQLKLTPIKTVSGTEIPLGFKTKTNDLSRPGEAAGATIGGAVLLGPLGLVGGYFIPGKDVKMKPGDKLSVEVSKDVLVRAAE